MLTNKSIAIGNSIGCINIFDCIKKISISTIKLESTPVKSIIDMKDGRLVISSGENSIKIWNYLKGQLDATLGGSTGCITCVVVIKGNIIASSLGPTITIWNGNSGEFLKVVYRPYTR